jgi:hypothetical protein
VKFIAVHELVLLKDDGGKVLRSKICLNTYAGACSCVIFYFSTDTRSQTSYIPN